MTGKRRPFNRRISKPAVGTLDTLDDRPVPAGWLRCYQRFGGLDVDNTTTYFRFVFGGSNPTQVIWEKRSTTADNFYGDANPVWMREGQYMRVIVGGATASDDLSLHVTGYDLKI